MKFNEKLSETLEKKAFGFSYTEETKEYEIIKSKPYLFCEKRNLLYFSSGYIKVKKVVGGVAVKQVEKFTKPIKKIKKLKNLHFCVTDF